MIAQEVEALSFDELETIDLVEKKMEVKKNANQL